jgi:hypothetical protein
MVETISRKRIEILTDTALVRRVTAAIDSAGITGWTILPVNAGKGRDGFWHEEQVTGTDKSLVLTVASQEKAAVLADSLAPILTSHGLLLTMWDVEVIRGDRF